MNKSKQSKIQAINSRTSHNNKCDLRKYNLEGDEKRCTNCTEFFPLDEIKNSGRCKVCWALEAKHRRHGTLEDYKKEILHLKQKVEENYKSGGVKKCNTCLEVKHFNNFYNENNSWDGRQNKCKDCSAMYNSNYSPYKKEYNKIKHKEYYDYKRKNDPQFKMILNLRGRLGKLVREYKNNGRIVKQGSSIKMIGVPMEDFIYYIEEQWVVGYMNWDNHGEVWELDHIVPISSYDLTIEKQLQECFYYTNYQPLFKLTTIIDGVEYIGNRNKSNKIN